MSELKQGSITIFEALDNIKNSKYVIPAFQRQFVWNMDQIEKLWDSILLDYPISTFLFWRVDENNTTWDTYFMNFLNNLTFNSKNQADWGNNNYKLNNFDSRYNEIAILDGQQRLTALYVSLYGTLYIRQKNARKANKGGTISGLFIELDRNKSTVDVDEFNSKQFDVQFNTKIGRVSPTYFDVKEIMNEQIRDDDWREKFFEEKISKVPDNSKEYARNILNKLYKKIYVEKILNFTEIIGMKHNDALEMFVRFNSGGKALKKSEITMSILEAYWPQAKQEFSKLLCDELSRFGSDFVIRTALMIYGDVIKSTINRKLADDLKQYWNAFKRAIRNTANFLKDNNIEVERFAGSWNVLLPIIYVIYYNPESWVQEKDAMRAYLIRAVLFGYFNSGTTAKLQQMKSDINAFNGFITFDLLNQRTELMVTQAKLEDLMLYEKGSRMAGEILYYISKDWVNPAYKYEQDHLHPTDRFDETQPPSISMATWSTWKGMKNRMPNLEYYWGIANAGKGSVPLSIYLDQMNPNDREVFKQRAFIPENVSLDISEFDKFYKERSKLLIEKIKELVN